MIEKTGQIFSIIKDNPAVAGCTVSKSIYSEKGYNFTYFSLAECTDISAETYEYPKICIVNFGKIEVYTSDNEIVRTSSYMMGVNVWLLAVTIKKTEHIT